MSARPRRKNNHPPRPTTSTTPAPSNAHSKPLTVELVAVPVIATAVGAERVDDAEALVGLAVLAEVGVPDVVVAAEAVIGPEPAAWYTGPVSGSPVTTTVSR